MYVLPNCKHEHPDLLPETAAKQDIMGIYYRDVNNLHIRQIGVSIDKVF